MTFQSIINSLKRQPKNLFLIDGTGAILSVLLLGLVIAGFEATFGMPRKVALFLSFLAFLFAVYSWVGYFRIKEGWRRYIRRIAIVNLLYCLLTLGLIVYFFESLTKLGVLYFIIEIIVILGLVRIEFTATSTRPLD